MKHFIVKLNLRNGDYEKNVVRLVSSENDELACSKALVDECHNDPEDDSFSEGGVFDMNDECFISVTGCKEVLREDVIVLNRYF